MRFYEPQLGDRIRFLPVTDKNFYYERVVDRPGCDCPHCIKREERGEKPMERHMLNVLDTEDGQVKQLRVPTSALKRVLEMYRQQMFWSNMIVRQQQAARNFRRSKMKYRR